MTDSPKRYESWGRYPVAKPAKVIALQNREDNGWRDDPLSVLPFGQGRSYGDTCLNNGATLLDTASLASVMEFDKQLGVLRCEAGATLADILTLIVPHNWFLPVTPGTKQVSIGGAIAHDVHGKNHHRAGTFGRYVKRFELVRSSGERVICSAQENAELFGATIAGMGLTGLITWAEFELKRIPGPAIAIERIPFGNLDEFFALAITSDRDYEYTVAWLDSRFSRGHFGKGVLLCGNSAEAVVNKRRDHSSRTRSLPFSVPNFLLNRPTIRAMNSIYYQLQTHQPKTELIDFDPFFYPLDAIPNWNRIYGSSGFLQYQCVVPYAERDAVQEIFKRIARSGLAAVLTVLKVFGELTSPGMLSFPRPGITLAIDFPFRGSETLELLNELDEIVLAARGAVYPAKDARMSAEAFQEYFPNWKAFARFVDPKFSSSFWRRVTRKGLAADSAD
ncbi:MAG TPA: FAD-binding oxidoreductase [Pyrinomonadaceae bacterium]|nr:FAD-binding oxidoreductase [Pyrinomonadaceae bacterium]